MKFSQGKFSTPFNIDGIAQQYEIDCYSLQFFSVVWLDFLSCIAILRLNFPKIIANVAELCG